MTCISCLRGFHEECLPGCDNCHPKIEESQSLTIEHKEDRLAWSKENNDVRDPHSTGRKRAAKLFPLDKQAPCEWQGKGTIEFPGTNLKPVETCTEGKQQCRHHIDYNTLNNSETNVVRICHTCHVKFHWNNDPIRQVKKGKLSISELIKELDTEDH